jgi:hypothetical protein
MVSIQTQGVPLMLRSTSILGGMERWLKISDDTRYAKLPPLPRHIQAVRDQSGTDQDLLAIALGLCEADLAISMHEYPHRQGLSVFYESAVFSAQGLGGDLCSHYGYDFWTFLQGIASISRDSADPAQYHQCINENLFNSPVEDDIIVRRFESLGEGDIRKLGCIVDTVEQLRRMVPRGGPGKRLQRRLQKQSGSIPQKSPRHFIATVAALVWT